MKKVILFLCLLALTLTANCQTIDYLENDSTKEIIKITGEGLAPRVRVYQSIEDYNNPTKFVRYIGKGYPAPKELAVLLSTPEIINDTTSLYDLAINKTYTALLKWIESNPNKDSVFGEITDWKIVYKY